MKIDLYSDKYREIAGNIQEKLAEQSHRWGSNTDAGLEEKVRRLISANKILLCMLIEKNILTPKEVEDMMWNV